MIEDAVKCKKKALELLNSEHPPREESRRKCGYREVMLNLWNENLHDVVTQAEKRKSMYQLSNSTIKRIYAIFSFILYLTSIIQNKQLIKC